MRYIHETAEVDYGAGIHGDVTIWRWTHVASTAVIGEGTKVGQGCYIAGRVGKNCRIQNGVFIFEGVVIRDNVFIGPGVVFTNVNKPSPDRKMAYDETLICKNVIIGANSTIVCPVSIYEGAFIGVGSVVTRNVPAGERWWGNPASKEGK